MMLERKFLWIPIGLLVLVFLVDSVFRIHAVQGRVKLDLTPVNYQAKADLLQRLIDEYDPKKRYLLILGSSRFLYFDAKALQDFYPEWEIYNFSSAVTTPAYYHYQIEKLLQAGIRPDLILLETDPNQFNKNGVFRISNLTYSFDLGYVLRYANVFGKEMVSFYLGRKLFAVGTFKPFPVQIYRNLAHPNLAAFLEMQKTTYHYILDNKGHGLSPVENYIEKDWNALQSTSERTLDWLFSYYSLSEMQLSFFQMTLQTARESKIPLVVVWPISSPPFEEMLQASSLPKLWEPRVREMTEKEGGIFLDLRKNPDYHCNAFADGGHIAQECYGSLIRSVLSAVPVPLSN